MKHCITAAMLLAALLLAGNAVADGGWTCNTVSGSTPLGTFVAGELVGGTYSYTNKTCTRTTPDVTKTRVRGSSHFVSTDGTIIGRGRWRWRRSMGPGLARSFHYRGRINYFKQGEGLIDTVILESCYKYDENGELVYLCP